jgi:hypothetical protein
VYNLIRQRKSREREGEAERGEGREGIEEKIPRKYIK